jgi:5-formyltetrahydrofolate cyclo-ligase
MLVSKINLRNEIKKKHQNLTEKKRNRYSLSINKNLKLLLAPLNSKCLCLFIPTPLGPNIDINYLQNKYSHVYCPKLINTNYHYTLVTPHTKLTASKYNIQEPTSSECIDTPSLHSPNTIFLVPLVGFDKTGNRLGHGNGYYDQLLVNTSGIKIGICFSYQEVPLFQSEPHDIGLTHIITEKEIVHFKKK